MDLIKDLSKDLITSLRWNIKPDKVDFMWSLSQGVEMMSS